MLKLCSYSLNVWSILERYRCVRQKKILSHLWNWIRLREGVHHFTWGWVPRGLLLATSFFSVPWCFKSPFPWDCHRSQISSAFSDKRHKKATFLSCSRKCVFWLLLLHNMKTFDLMWFLLQKYTCVLTQEVTVRVWSCVLHGCWQRLFLWDLWIYRSGGQKGPG